MNRSEIAIRQAAPTSSPRRRAGSLASRVALLAAFGLLLVMPAHAGHLPVPTNCQPDVDGANDQPGQKDVSQYCIDVGDGSPYELIVSTNWDNTTLTGNNTADVCTLFDTDNDGLANIAVCATLQSSGAGNGNLAVLKEVRLFTCTDTRADRCTGSVLVPGPHATICEVAQKATDPFPPAATNGPGDQYPLDTEINCGIDLNDFGVAGTGAVLLDGCSYPSSVPNSDPSDCIAYQTCSTDADCDDGNPCTADTCDLTGACVTTPTPNVPCSDGLYCNGDEVCNSLGFCVAATPRNCDDGIACTLDSCDELTDSCINDPRNSLCSDGQFCNGAETCDPLSGCVAGTPPNCGDGVSCTTDVCDEINDACVNTPSNAACNDGLYCNGLETCDALNGCQVGTPPNCNDSVSCTIDSCNEVSDSCDHLPNNAACSDGQYCNGAETCDAINGCQVGTPPNCNDSVGCTVDSCNEVSDSCDHLPNNAACSDGQYCNGAETCDALNGCQAGVAPNCGDGVGCTTDACNEATDSCTHTPNDAACSDGLFCTGSETCDLTGDCQPGTPPNCADAVVCTVDACDEATDSCTHTPSNAVCDDSQFCNGVETCNALTGCQAGTAPDCNDGIACTADSCNEVTDGCDNIPSNGFCSDGLFCTGVEVCNPSTGCETGSDPCPGALCSEPLDQCVDCLVDADCDNGVYCDGAETCNVGTGVCQPGTPPNCNDGVSCTQDSCNESTNSCDNVPSAAACSDNLYCTGVETCDPVNGCQAGTPPDCNDGVSCTADVCNETLNACTHTPNNGVCSDGQFCNGAETCDAIAGCQAGVPPNCNDGVDCTGDSCNETTDSCSNVPNNAACNDGQFCNGAETCDAVTGCEPGTPPDCVDAVGCTVDACDEGSDSCTHTPNDAACSDAQYCNGIETCDPVNDCQAGAPPDCVDAVGCTVDACDEGSDSCTHTPNDAACSDGEFCNGAETCDAVVGCEPGTPPSCSDGIPCSTNFCNEATDQCESDFPDCFCGDGQATGTEECDPPATAATFEDCNNLVDDDGDGKIDCRDKDCAPGARETLCDEGCTLDQVCEKFIKDPGLITYGWRTGKHDRFVLHGRFLLKKPSLLPMQNGFTFEMSNEDGVFYRIFLEETQFTVNRRGTGFRFLDKSSRDLGESSPSSGVYKVSLKQRNYSGVPYVSFKIVAYGDFGGATDVEMTTQLAAGSAIGGLTAEWSARYGVWRLDSRNF